MPRYAVIPIPEFLGRYLVGTDGSVWSLWRKGRWGGWRDEPFRMAETIDKNGYVQIGITVNNRSRLYYVHHLVLITFRGPKPPDMEALHEDGVRTNNRLKNLRWGTALENSADKRRHGTQLMGSKCSWATIDEEMAAAIKYDLLQGLTPLQISRQRPVRRTVIYNIKDGKAWKHVEAKADSGCEKG